MRRPPLLDLELTTLVALLMIALIWCLVILNR
jgi:hypothetical protein